VTIWPSKHKINAYFLLVINLITHTKENWRMGRSFTELCIGYCTFKYNCDKCSISTLVDLHERQHNFSTSEKEKKKYGIYFYRIHFFWITYTATDYWPVGSLIPVSELLRILTRRFLNSLFRSSAALSWLLTHSVSVCFSVNKRHAYRV